VKDAGGAILPGVTVVAIDAGTSARSETVSDDRGSFVIPQLPPGTYRIEASLTGFKQFVREGVVVSVQQQIRVEIPLEVGAIAETVKVVAQESLLETTTSSVGKVVDNARIKALPLNTRNVYSLIFLTPGVTGSIGKSPSKAATSARRAWTGGRAIRMPTTWRARTRSRACMCRIG
jgi:hypothetical protein